MNSLSHKWSYMRLLSSISAWLYLYALGFTYIHLGHPYALPSPSCTFLQLYTPDFKRRVSFSFIRLSIHLYALPFTYSQFHSLIRTFIHLHALPFTYTPLSFHQYALFFTFQRFSSALYALVFTYMRLLSLMCSFQTVFSPICRIVVGHILRRICCNFCCRSVHDYRHEYTL